MLYLHTYHTHLTQIESSMDGSEEKVVQDKIGGLLVGSPFSHCFFFSFFHRQCALQRVLAGGRGKHLTQGRYYHPIVTSAAGPSLPLLSEYYPSNTYIQYSVAYIHITCLYRQYCCIVKQSTAPYLHMYSNQPVTIPKLLHTTIKKQSNTQKRRCACGIGRGALRIFPISQPVGNI